MVNLYEQIGQVVHTYSLQRTTIVYDGVTCYYLSVRDMTVSERLEQAEKEKEKIQLLTSNITHELMQPIQCVQIFTRQILRSKISP